MTQEYLNSHDLQGIAKQLVRALHYLHSNRIIHRWAALVQELLPDHAACHS